MEISHEKCGVTQGCTSQVVFACSCGSPIIFLCKDCTVTHLAEPFTHTFISLEQARETLKDLKFSETLAKSHKKYTKIKNSILSYIKNIQTFRDQVHSFKQELLSLIQTEFTSKLLQLDQLEQTALSQLDTVKKSMNSFTTLRDDLLFNYDVNGLEGILDTYQDTFHLNQIQIKQILPTIINISKHSEDLKNYQNRYIYIAKNSSTNLIKYDTQSNSTYSSDLSSSISTNFNYSSTCCVQNGTVMIVGGYNPASGDTYRYDTTSGTCTKLDSLNNPRGWIHLTCVNNHLYAFGGYAETASKKAEMMDWTGSGWISLSDMQESRFYCGSWSYESKIYIIGGENRTTVECYDMNSNSFRLIGEVSIRAYYNVVGEIDDRIYVVNSGELSILNQELEVIEVKNKVFNSNLWNLSDVVRQGKNLMFYCYCNKAVLAFDTSTKEIRRLLSI